MAIRLHDVTKSFPGNDSAGAVAVVDHVDLDAPDGRIVALFGPNGCGKTTILNIIAQIEPPDTGSVSVIGPDSRRLKVGYAFQNFRDTLLPWESAFDNVSFGLRAQGMTHESARQRVAAFLDQHGLDIPRKNYPYQLSIGQQQTVALTRTLVQNPSNVLLDEAFSALDHKARFRMQDLVVSLIRASGSTMIVVSHDVDECLLLSQEFILLSKRPARIIKRFPVPFEYPRKHELLASTEFAALRREVVAEFVKEVGA
ncbi:MAG: ABC transporter ATP-binding protein [Verrucomicrobiae bacterium]|nr:ABC transporter ATP-binding protein [Verrucomicrobiae bacterium]